MVKMRMGVVMTQDETGDRRLVRLVAAAGAALCLSATAAAAADCYPHCDYNHYYGPYDLTHVRPGLYAYPVCGPRGNCAPYSVYRYSGVPGGTIEIRFPRRPRVVRP